MSQAYDFDITSANASAVLTVDSLFPSGIELQMFATDQAVGQDSVDITETRMGVDGRMVAGFTPVIYPVTVTLEAASPSAKNLGTVWRAMKTVPGHLRMHPRHHRAEHRQGLHVVARGHEKRRAVPLDEKGSGTDHVGLPL